MCDFRYTTFLQFKEENGLLQELFTMYVPWMEPRGFRRLSQIKRIQGLTRIRNKIKHEYTMRGRKRIFQDFFHAIKTGNGGRINRHGEGNACTTSRVIIVTPQAWTSSSTQAEILFKFAFCIFTWRICISKLRQRALKKSSTTASFSQTGKHFRLEETTSGI